MKHILSHTLKLVFRVDGAKIWWWSANRQVWFPEYTVTPAALQRSLDNGTATEVTNPETTQ